MYVCMYVCMYTHVIYTSLSFTCAVGSSFYDLWWPKIESGPGGKVCMYVCILGADDTGLCGRFSQCFLAHDMGFMYRFCYGFLFYTWHGSYAPT